MKLLIAGFGSAGQRHAVAALHLGCEVVTWDPQTSKEAFVDRLEREQGLTHVCICSPPEVHFEQTLVCLHHRLHVLVEKPLALTVVDGQMLVEVAAEYGVQLRVACQLRFLESFQKIRDDFLEYRHDAWVGSCVFGYDIRRWHPPTTAYQPRIGVLHEVGTHELDLLCWLYGTAPIVGAPMLTTIHPGWGDQPCAISTILQFHASELHLHLDYVSPWYQRSLMLSSEKRYVVWQLQPQQQEAELQRASHAMLKAFVREDENATLATGADGVAVLQVLEALKTAGTTVAANVVV